MWNEETNEHEVVTAEQKGRLAVGFPSREAFGVAIVKRREKGHCRCYSSTPQHAGAIP
jgi:hypothetical protein